MSIEFVLLVLQSISSSKDFPLQLTYSYSLSVFSSVFHTPFSHSKCRSESSRLLAPTFISQLEAPSALTNDEQSPRPCAVSQTVLHRSARRSRKLQKRKVDQAKVPIVSHCSSFRGRSPTNRISKDPRQHKCSPE